MECNRDEAVRAKSVAEAKLAEKDFASAKKFALKAQSLFPGLFGISQMLTMVNVYISSEKMVNGMIDWYGVLDVSPTADDETIKKQYKKLALVLHPDKNSFIGADGAFKLVYEAWRLLSDKVKRSAYNLLMGHYDLHPKVPTNPGPSTVFTTGPFPQPGPFSQPGPSNDTGSLFTQPGGPSTVFSSGPFVQPGGPSKNNGSPFTQPGGPSGNSAEGLFTKFTSKKPPTPKTQKSVNKASGPGSSNQKVDSFWTVCDKCKVQYEYRNIYRNCTLLCPNCKNPFLATEIPRPVSKSKSPKPTPWVPFQQQQGPVENGNNSHAPPPSGNNIRGKNVVVEGKKPEAGRTGSDISVQARQGPVPAPAGVNTSAGPSAATKVTTSRNKKKRPMSTESNGAMEAKDNVGQRKNNGNGEIRLGQNGDSGTTESKFKAHVFPKLEGLELRKLAVYKAGMQILEKIDEAKKAEEASLKIEKQIQKSATREMGSVLKNTKEKSKSNGNNNKKADGNLPLPTEVDHAEAMEVPDPDFYQFDEDRSERSFAKNDVWARYDDGDGMPRLYAMIRKVISKKPFQVEFSFLNTTTTAEFNPNLEWIENGFHKTCGDFRIGKHQMCRLVNTFSHKVKWSKGKKGAIMIFPEKDDVWALYRNWSPDWDCETPTDVVRKYDMVKVLEGYEEEKGLVLVAPLVKVAGFKTVFRLNTDKEAVSEIRREEMLRFSHMVPHHDLPSDKAPGFPDGCVELDSAALPMELLGIEVGAEGGNTR